MLAGATCLAKPCSHSRILARCSGTRGPNCFPMTPLACERIARLVDQRLRDDDGIVDVIAVEPIITLLLENHVPWRSGEYAKGLLRDWLRGHVVANTAAGHRLRILLRERLVEACAAADRRLAEKQAAAAAARDARTPEEVERDRRFVESHSGLFSEMGYGGRNRPTATRGCPRA